MLVPTVSVAVECAAHLGVTKDRVAVVAATSALDAVGLPFDQATAGILSVLVFGAVRLPYESGLSRQLHEARLFPPKLQIGTRAKIGLA